MSDIRNQKHNAASAVNSDLILPVNRSDLPFDSLEFKSSRKANIVNSADMKEVENNILKELEQMKQQNQSLREAAVALENEVKRLQKSENQEAPAARQLHTMLAVYDDRIKELEANIQRYQVELQSLTIKYQESTEANTQLKNSLQNKLERELSSSVEERQKASGRIALLAQENEILTQQQRSLTAEIEKLRDNLVKKTKELCSAVNGSSDAQDVIQGLKFDLERLTEANSLLEKDLRTCMTDLSQFSSENERLQAESKRREVESRTWASKVNELQKSLDLVTSKYKDQTQEASLMVSREREYVDSLRAAEADLEDYKVKYTQAIREVSALREENEKVYKKYRNVEERNFELEEQHVEYFKQQQKQQDKLQSWELEKEKAKVLQQQLAKENERLTSQLEAQIRSNADAVQGVEKQLRAEWATEKRKYVEEIHNLEIRNSEVQSQTDRAIRDKRSAEEELAKIHAQLPTESTRLNSVIEELSIKLRQSERERFDAANALESVKQQLHREQNKKQTDKEDYANRATDLHRRLRRAETGLEEVKEEKVRLLTKLSDSEHQYRLLDEKYNNIVTHHSVEVQALQEKFNEQVEDIRLQLVFSQDSHKKTSREMQQLVYDQKRAAEKWHVESKHIAEQYVSMIEDLKRSTTLLQTNVSDLTLQLNAAQIHRSELSYQLTEEKKSQARLALLLDSADLRTAQLQKQVQDLLERETELLQHKKRLESDLERQKQLQAKSSVSEQSLAQDLRSTKSHVTSLQESIDRVKQRLGQSKS